MLPSCQEYLARHKKLVIFHHVYFLHHPQCERTIVLLLSRVSTQTFTQCIAEPEVAQSENLNLLQQLLSCVTSITMATDPAPDLPHSQGLFEVMLRVQASGQAGLLASEVDKEMTRLAALQGLPDKQHLYGIHASPIIDSLQVGLPTERERERERERVRISSHEKLVSRLIKIPYGTMYFLKIRNDMAIQKYAWLQLHQ